MAALTDADALKQSREHLSYELEMLFLTSEILLTSPAPVTVRDVTVKNALIESFAIHLRVLSDFIDDTGSKLDDVLAKHFVRDESKWKAARPALTAEVAEASGARANKEVAHLTAGRVFGMPPEKAWDVQALRAAVADRLRVFIEHASPARLHPRFGERLNALTSGRVDLDARFAP